MILPFKPTSNAERQREFCERNPGYYRKYSAQRRAQEKAVKANFPAIVQALMAKHQTLALPATVETIEIPGMTTIDAIPAGSLEPVLVEVSAPKQATTPLLARFSDSD